MSSVEVAMSSRGVAILNILDHLNDLARGDDKAKKLAVALIREAHPGAEAAGTQRLQEALQQFMHALLAHLTPRPLHVDPQNGVFWMDDVGARVLADVGPYGSDLATSLRENADARWEKFLADGSLENALALWTAGSEDDENWNGEPLFVQYAALALWFDRIEPLIRTGTAVVPAVSAAVLSSLHATLWRHDRALRESPDGLVLASRGSSVARVRVREGGTVVLQDIVEGLRASRTLTAHRLVRWVIAQGYRQFAAGLPDFRRIRVAGGFTALANMLGIASAKETAHLREALEFGQHLEISLPDELAYGLWTWSLRGPHRGTPARISIIVGDPLLPQFVSALPKGAASRTEARRVVPIPERLPPLGGHPYSFASQAVLQLLVIREMRSRAEEFATTGTITLPRAGWVDLADEAELSVRNLDQVLAAWTTGDEKAPQFLARHGDSYGLGPAYDEQRAVLVQAGRMSALARSAQRASARARRANRAARESSG